MIILKIKVGEKLDSVVTNSQTMWN